MQQADGEGAARAHARTGGHVGEAGNLHAFGLISLKNVAFTLAVFRNADSQLLQALAHQRVLDLFHPVDVFSLRIADAQLVVEVRVNGDVNIFVDGGANHRAAVLPIEAGEVAAAAGKADAKWRARDDHRNLSCNAASPVADPMSMNLSSVVQALSCCLAISAGNISSSSEHFPSGIALNTDLRNAVAPASTWVQPAASCLE